MISCAEAASRSAEDLGPRACLTCTHGPRLVCNIHQALCSQRTDLHMYVRYL